jgi:SAM-dependent methyltransferase
MGDFERLRDYYEAILPFYDGALEERGDLPFWESIAARWSPRRALELGCGTGRVTAVLSRHAQVTGVDLLLAMLLRAREQAPRARFLAADLRGLAFAARFDLIALADDPMAHLTSTEERREVMRRIADHLTPEGHLVLEGLYRQPGKAFSLPARVTLRHEANPLTVEESWTPAAEASVWSASYRYTQGSSSAQVTTMMRSWSIVEVEGLAQLGLHVEKVLGDFDERPFSSNSKRIVIIARRRDR